MSRKTVLTLLVACGTPMLLSGCGGQDLVRQTYESKLSSAYSQLENGRFSSAMSPLEQASKIAEENGYNQTEIKKLKAEACLGVGDLVCAYDQAQELLNTEPSNPYALELLGKVCIREKRYSEAEEYLNKAKLEHKETADISRVTDLIAVTRGLSAYSEGNPKLAERYFRSIENVDLQFSIDTTRKNLGSNKY